MKCVYWEKSAKIDFSVCFSIQVGEGKLKIDASPEGTYFTMVESRKFLSFIYFIPFILLFRFFFSFVVLCSFISLNFCISTSVQWFQIDEYILSFESRTKNIATTNHQCKKNALWYFYRLNTYEQINSSLILTYSRY